MSRSDALKIYQAAVQACMPDESVKTALRAHPIQGSVTLFAIGKAAHRMALAAMEALGEQVTGGMVISKYGHIPAPIAGLVCMEAGHPVPDENSMLAAQRALKMAQTLREGDTALVLLSGGGSALFELPADGVTLQEAAQITQRLLQSGASIDEINCVRKHLSKVKGGRFAQALSPARVLTVALSDVLSDAPDVIASGPTCPDSSTSAAALAVIGKYAILLSDAARAALACETPKELENAQIVVSGSVRELCEAACRQARALGYDARIADRALTGEARLEGARVAAMARKMRPRSALIFGGETVVHVQGDGRGGRCQEFVLGGALTLEKDMYLLAAGSDGTDGPTDAAGAVIDGGFGELAGETAILSALERNDAYPLLKRHEALIFTGATGTNVNDLYLLLRLG